MQVKQDPVTGLWARIDGAILMPPSHRGGMHYHWTFGTEADNGYLVVGYKGKRHLVHRIICRSFHGLPSKGKPFCDHKSRVKSENFASNLHWASPKENNDNANCVDRSVERYGVRWCEDRKAYDAAYASEKKARGLSYRKGSDGKQHWLPRIKPELKGEC